MSNDEDGRISYQPGADISWHVNHMDFYCVSQYFLTKDQINYLDTSNNKDPWSKLENKWKKITLCILYNIV